MCYDAILFCRRWLIVVLNSVGISIKYAIVIDAGEN